MGCEWELAEDSIDVLDASRLTFVVFSTTATAGTLTAVVVGVEEVAIRTAGTAIAPGMVDWAGVRAGTGGTGGTGVAVEVNEVSEVLLVGKDSNDTWFTVAELLWRCPVAPLRYLLNTPLPFIWVEEELARDNSGVRAAGMIPCGGGDIIISDFALACAASRVFFRADVANVVCEVEVEE